MSQRCAFWVIPLSCRFKESVHKRLMKSTRGPSRTCQLHSGKAPSPSHTLTLGVSRRISSVSHELHCGTAVSINRTLNNQAASVWIQASLKVWAHYILKTCLRNEWDLSSVILRGKWLHLVYIWGQHRWSFKPSVHLIASLCLWLHLIAVTIFIRLMTLPSCNRGGLSCRYSSSLMMWRQHDSHYCVCICMFRGLWVQLCPWGQ